MKSSELHKSISDEITKSIKAHEKDLDEALKILTLLANPTRLKMAYLLSQKELCTTDLERILNAEQTLISHHLKDFKKLNLTRERREGKWRYYSIKDKKLRDIFRAIEIEGTKKETA
ncbi:MAG: ArsR/SmtB family transcription factor [Candidatus Hydrothermarchaeales archaeon]